MTAYGKRGTKLVLAGLCFALGLVPARQATGQLVLSGRAVGGGPGFTTQTAPMMKTPQMNTGKEWAVEPVFTVGEAIGGYLPPGILDGIGAFKLDRNTVRVLVNHELREDAGYPYALANGTQLTGARVSYFDLDARSRRVVASGLAYDTVIDRRGVEVTDPAQIHEGAGEGLDGMHRFCSSAYFGAGEYGLVDGIYFNGEETGDGQAFALDVEAGVLYAVPWLGRAAWENLTLLDTGDEDTIAVLVGDDRQGAPLYLYIGEKDALGNGGFLDRNGLARGTLHVWVSDSGDVDPEDFNGTGQSRAGRFVEIDHHQPGLAGTDGYDDQGFATMAKQDELAEAVGGFHLSRPEDVATNPQDGTQAVLASTGRGGAFPSDDWGTTLLIDVDFADLSARLTILYDSDDAGDGQFFNADFGMRSPDNLDWADNGMIYLQEDRSTRNGVFGGDSQMEASMWELDPATGRLSRALIMDRSVLPAGQSDGDPGDLGDWESSGVLDVTSLFNTWPGETLLIGDVQAHSVRDGIIADEGLVQGGQLILMSSRPSVRQEFVTDTRPMMLNQDDWSVRSIFTVGEEVGGYLPPGILDGIGAYRHDERTVRVLVNHELREDAGYTYTLANGTRLTGARVSYFDIDARTRRVIDTGLAYDTVIDRAGDIVTDPSQIHEGAGEDANGMHRFCSSGFFGGGEYGLVDGIYFTGEETGDGQAFALDVARGTLYAVPWLGRAAWENVTLLDTGDDDTIAVLVGDDRQGAPLYLYIGEKDALGDGGFLDRNGLARGTLHVWVSDSGDVDPEDFNGTNATRTGRFVEIDHYRPNLAGTDGYDVQGFATMAKQNELAEAVGTFHLSRPEDVATNPQDGTQAVLASTGRGGAFPSDDWGTTLLIDVDFADLSARLTILYDGDDAGGGQFSDPDFGMRSPDNLDWADDGMIYLQEDRSTRNGVFGGVSKMEASMWELDPVSGRLTRSLVMNRSVLPAGQSDGDPGDLGDWESSGVLDVTSLFKTRPGETLLIGDVQAHSVRDGIIADRGLVQGGQLILVSRQADASAKLAAAAGDDGASLGNTPNPFNPSTNIHFTLPEAGKVSLTVYNIQGQKVASLVDDVPYAAGRHAVQFDGSALASGMYFYRLEAGSFSKVAKMTLMK